MRIAFLGTPAFAVPTADALARAGHELVTVVAQPDRPAGRGQTLRAPATKEWALARGIPVLQPEKVRDGTLATALAALRPDVLVVTAYGRILGKDLLGLAPLGAVNVHASLLPRWRGAAPIQWSVASGERETGVSIMAMDEGLDTGDVLLQRPLAIGDDETAEALAPRLAALGGDAVVEALALLGRDAIVPVRQDAARATLAPILKREDGRVDWARPAQAIRDRLRGFTPWPGAWTTLDGKVVKVLDARVVMDGTNAADGAPGHGVLADGEIVVRCGEGTALALLRLQLEGRAAASAADVANGLRLKRFGFGR
jgi:methionyl-tRNA formyltransferase